jgi:hypothetical protein
MEEADQVRPPSSVTKASFWPGWETLEATTVQVEALEHDLSIAPISNLAPEEPFTGS